MPPPVGFGTVRVNGVEIEPEAIAAEIQHHPAPDPQTAWTEAARALAVRELLLQEARRLDVAAEAEADEAGRTEVEEDAIIAALLDQAIEPDLPSDEECSRYYETRRHRFRTPDLFEVSHILLEPEGDDETPWSEAESRARLIAAEVGDDPAAFAEAARELSACPSARQDGSLGQVRRGELVPQIQAAVEALAPGHTMQEPVRSRFGWHVLRLHRRIEGQVLPFEAVHGKIAEMLAARSWTVASTRYVAGLAARATIEGVAIEAPG
jgi:peptidyl-prolyl cis-trans isomerase C